MDFSLVDFATFYKLVGGAGLVGLSAQLVGILKINRDIVDLLKDIESSREKHESLGFVFNLPLEVEDVIDDFYLINNLLKWIICFIILSALSVALYALLQNVQFPLASDLGWKILVISQRIWLLILILVPITLTCTVFWKYINIHVINFKRYQEGNR
ncbi:hypothetical protein [Fodinibius saliphilus]|uniref:hypothetical protein n=1 Tax=Fodinibius saliphilus TaxID=1920650 RepID=UPI001108D503|nr:hypothetical protein [Fodinibius saliphilus]